MKANELLKKWLSILSDSKAIIKVEPIISKNTKVSDMGDANAKFIAELIRETIVEVESPSEISPYNPAHTMYGDCCGIFNRINDDGILCCNECGMTIHELIDAI